MIWAIVRRSGAFTLRHTDGEHPAEAGHRRDCRGANVWQLTRDPDLASGERVDYATGAIVFDLGAVQDSVLAEIKAAAGQHIEAFAPLWRQLNDMAEPDNPGAAGRARDIRAVRDWSTDLEARLAQADSATKLRNVRAALADWRKSAKAAA
jgi:hypothetical protein